MAGRSASGLSPRKQSVVWKFPARTTDNSPGRRGERPTAARAASSVWVSAGVAKNKRMS